ncbi:MAG: cytochrome c oxidase subunit 3, partial [Roseibium polysiphoniae]
MAEAHTKNHDYHLVDPSPWPFLASVGAFILALGAIGFMKLG